jgi:NADPH:quinone reductase-like Zn-dependent oxidoreductase
MKAAQITEYGHSDVIHVVDTETPKVSEGTVVVEVHAASINPFDRTVREGHMKDYMPALPVTLGGDLAGVVSAVAPDVTHVAVGDKVYGQAQVIAGNSGAFAEFARTKATQVAAMPATLNFAEAAAAPLTGLSAQQALIEHMNIQAGQKILIHGGAGGIGTIAIQLAKHLGAYVATTATGEGLAYVKELGADEVIDYKTQEFEELLHDYDAVFDTVAGETYQRSFKVLKKGGVIVSMLAQPDQALMQQYGVTAITQQTKITIEALESLAKLIDDGIVTVHVDRTYPLDEIQQAFAAWENGSIRGKVVLLIKK